MAAINDRKTSVVSPLGIMGIYLPTILSATDYYAFGLEMPSRSYSSEKYRYGFNGKENDRGNWSSTQLVQDYGMRLYNPALGRFLSVDPISKQFPWYTPYQFAGNKPIIAIDLDGLEEFVKTYIHDSTKGTVSNVSVSYDLSERDLEGANIHSIHIYKNDAGATQSTRVLQEYLPSLDFRPGLGYGYPNRNNNYSFNVRGSDTRGVMSKSNLFDEFCSGTGPENSVIFGSDHTMIEDIKDLAGVNFLTGVAINRWLSDDGKITNSDKPALGLEGDFGIKGGLRVFFGLPVGKGASFTYPGRLLSTEHFLGSYTLNISVLEDNSTLLYTLTDQKTFDSITAHWFEGSSTKRGRESKPLSTSYQRFIWTQDLTKQLIDNAKANKKATDEYEKK